MNDETLAPGLYLTATPIGNARDITLRALDVLASADVLVAEDTRSLRHLMDIHGIALKGRDLIAYHDHSSEKARDGVVARVMGGAAVAFCSDAGSPLIADPGFELVRAVQDAGGMVTGLPGASSVIAALTLAGLPTDRFCFLGFLPRASGARKRALQEVADMPATLVLLESPKRVRDLLEDLCEVFDAGRQAALCREMTKRFEEVRRGSLADLSQGVSETPPRGEIVLVIDRPGETVVDDTTVIEALNGALKTQSLRDAVADVSTRLAVPRRRVYQLALDATKTQDP